jgi:hypothetical protein
MDDTQNSVNQAFFDMSIQFVEASVSAWPEDPLLPIALVQLRKQKPEDVLQTFEQHFGSLVTRLTAKEPEALVDAGKNALLQGLEVEAKYASASESTRETVWTYIGHLCRFASMQKLYKHIPKDVIGAVTEAAANLKSGLDDGSIDAATLNPMELGKKVMEKFKAEDIDAMMKQMMNNPEAIQAVMSQMSSIMGPNSGMPGGLDMSSMMAMLGPPK